MRVVDIIIKKRDGFALTTEEINFFIEGYSKGEIPDYQAAAFAMAVFFRGMSVEETTMLTLAMASSGKQLDLSHIAPVVADKHSTGGVGDKTTMVVTPLVAATGLPIAKMSGRGLGYFGGTVDKLETIPGFRAALSDTEFLEAFAKVGLVVSGQSSELAPADGKLYALRDVTGTVESIPLIAASVMSKKIAAGANCIVLDVKFGKGAFMKTLEDATFLAETMVEIGRGAGRKVRAVLSSMEQPLGWAVGNTLEVREAIETLQRKGPPDLLELAFILGSQLIVMSGRAENELEARAQLHQALDSGAAFEKYKQFVANQGGDTKYLDNPELLPTAPFKGEVLSLQSGYISAIDAEMVGITAHLLGAGRKVKTDPIDPAVGLILQHKVGDFVERGEPLLEIHARTSESLKKATVQILNAFIFSPLKVTPPAFIARIV
ncbi:MAG: pyrimidine-nucleoside phosphorylase [Chloroflexi bacterium]|uniref:Pyrimidine-nucleoside phosphorylase n=1 Tax=Candidatus Chlorohelix allophototropha TaxID=3003348 RepID=A0A8T7M6G0_9CHLR|nr:pyrimidine-nucleoside phosphorylase [Chloroflexota bacterium]WJW69565.1 pyrimidine-nucleoside phosphorylase [Chloroflexota bacterium L227-S17]